MNYDALNKELDAAIARIDANINRWAYMLGVVGCHAEATERIDNLNTIKDGLMTRYRY